MNIVCLCTSKLSPVTVSLSVSVCVSVCLSVSVCVSVCLSQGLMTAAELSLFAKLRATPFWTTFYENKLYCIPNG